MKDKIDTMHINIASMLKIFYTYLALHYSLCNSKRGGLWIWLLEKKVFGYH